MHEALGLLALGICNANFCLNNHVPLVPNQGLSNVHRDSYPNMMYSILTSRNRDRQDNSIYKGYQYN